MVVFCDTPNSSKVEPAVASCVHAARTRGESPGNLKAQRKWLGVPSVGDGLVHSECTIGIYVLLLAGQTSCFNQRET